MPPNLNKDMPSPEVTCIYLKEEEHNPSVVKKPLEWMLYTTVEVDDEETLSQVVGWYASRWEIKSYHKTLKIGCNIKSRNFAHSDEVEDCLALDLITAWKVACLKKLARDFPDEDCSVFFEESEWQALVFYLTKDMPPDNPPPLKEIVIMTAKLGGFLGRKSDGMPGVKTMWSGIQQLETITEMWQIMSPLKNKNE